MRKIAYSFNNKKYAEVVENFACLEKFTAVDLQAQANPDDTGSFIFFITDDIRMIEKGSNISQCCGLIDPKAKACRSYILLNDNFGVYTLRMLLDQIYHGNVVWSSFNDVQIQSIHKEIIAGNNMDDIEKLVCHLTWELLYFHNFFEVEKIRIGFSEMLTNAIEHGNFGITDTDKHDSTEAGTYSALLAARKSIEKYNNRKVHITLDFNGSTLVIVIRDEGNGFDTSSFPTPSEPEKLLNLHGRGILITRAYFDSVVYNEKGNEVTLTKHFY